ncbi:MAG: M3 family metallopeptidase, partial [Chloroflexota bacterium]|nr:M3 family metallopeptidase [Chloroflexota bacterium]
MVAEVTQSDVMMRDQVAPEDTWDLTTIYPDESGWVADADRVVAQLDAVNAYRGHLGDSATGLAKALDDLMAVRLTIEHLMGYAMLRRDEDTGSSEAMARYERGMALAIQASEALAFVDPELLALPEARFAALMADPALARYHHLLDDLGRNRPHVRSVEVEVVLAMGADVSRAPSDAFTALDNADLEFGHVRDETGAEVALTKGRHSLLLESKNRDVRREANQAFSQAYLSHRHTLAALHGASVRNDIFHAKVRNHVSAREAALFGDNIPTAVYDNLIASVRAAHPTLTRFLDLRRRVLKLDKLALYDLYVPLSP